jgi:hypothetical protein
VKEARKRYAVIITFRKSNKKLTSATADAESLPSCLKAERIQAEHFI